MTWRHHPLAELQAIADAIGDRSGWDFSRMVTEREPVPWEYADVVARYFQPTDHVLDIGTGGGERLLALAASFHTAVGIDPDPAMLRVARAYGVDSPRVTFEQMSAEDLKFADATFDVALCRHAPIDVPELDRVVKPGGLVISQGIGANNMGNIRQAFNPGNGTRYDDEYRHQVADLRTRGWRMLATATYDAAYWVKDMPSLLFWLKAIAGTIEVPADFSIPRHGAIVNELVAQFTTPRGFLTNEHRTLLIARKPDV